MEMQQVENKAKKDNTISVAKEIGSFGISLIPFLGDGKDLQESISGLDLITGKKLSALNRVLAGACVIVPVISGSMVRTAGKNADIAEKMSLLSEKQLFKKAGKGIAMCEDAKKEMEQLIQGIRTMLEEDADIKRLFAKNKNTGLQVEIAGVGKVSLEEAEKLVGKDVRWSRGKGIEPSNIGVGKPVKVEGRGNTGRTISNNLEEQMAMHQVQSNPLEGASELPIKLNDARWQSSEGWVKMQSVVNTTDGNKIIIHYVYNKVTGAFDDFKFK